MNCGYEIKWSYDPRSYECNFFIVNSFLARTVETTNDPLLTSVASQSGWLERRTGIARSPLQTSLKSWIFQASLSNCKNCVHNCEDHSFTWYIELRIWNQVSYDRRSYERNFSNNYCVGRIEAWKFQDLITGFEPVTSRCWYDPVTNCWAIKDVRANCFCASLLRTQIHTPRHTRARALSNKMRDDRAKGHCYSFAWI